MENKTKLVIQIPDEVIRNVDLKLDSNTFAMYAYLKFLHFRNYKNNEIELDHNKFKHKLYISDNRTLKKCFMKLHKEQIILELINKLPTKGAIKITFDPEPFTSKTFTQLPATVLNKIEHIGSIGLRLLFYYESFINRTDELSKQFAFPAIETISKSLGINKETIINYNNLLKKHKLIKVKKHKLEWNGEYDSLDQPLFTKYNNHYYVKLENL
jgi:RNA-binding protein YhbY